MIDMTFVVPQEWEHNTYALHAKLDELFGRRAETKYLWSIVPGLGGGALLYVRAPTVPTTAMPAFSKATPCPEAGDEATFSVVAMPTTKDARTGRRKPFTRENDTGRERWFQRRAEQFGFVPIEVRHASSRRWIGKPTAEKPHSPWWIDATTFVGRVRVTDAAVFREMLENGFGQGRAWGCGLFVVA